MATQNLILAQNIFVSIWNPNILTGQNYLKVSQSQAFKLVYKLYITSISETHLDSLILKDDNVLSIEGYSLIRADYLSNTKRGSVCISCSEKTSVTPINNIYLPEYFACEIVTGKKERVSIYLVLLSKSKSR